MRLPSARVVERVDPLTLESEEMALLDLLGPPLLVATPRAVKRLANSYGLLTALRRDDRTADLAEQYATITDPATGQLSEVAYRPYRAGMVLLAALVAFPAIGPALFLYLRHTAGADPHRTCAAKTASPSNTAAVPAATPAATGTARDCSAARSPGYTGDGKRDRRKVSSQTKAAVIDKLRELHQDLDKGITRRPATSLHRVPCQNSHNGPDLVLLWPLG